MSDDFEEPRDESVIMARREQLFLDKGTPYFKCPDCGAVSPNANDIANSYCFRCHAFKGGL